MARLLPAFIFDPSTEGLADQQRRRKISEEDSKRDEQERARSHEFWAWKARNLSAWLGPQGHGLSPMAGGPGVQGQGGGGLKRSEFNGEHGPGLLSQNQILEKQKRSRLAFLGIGLLSRPRTKVAFLYGADQANLSKIPVRP